VEAERADRSGYVKVTEAEIVYVAVGQDGRPVPLESEP
jgi:acyl-CoA hydrolase